MNEQMSELLKIVISYIAVLLIGYFGINFMSSGFLNKFIAVKISRGKKTLVEVHDVGGVYYRTGIITDGNLEYKNRKKEKKLLTNIKNEGIQYRMGLKCIATDAIKNTIIYSDGSQVEGHDPVKTDNLMTRCLTSPQLQDKIMKIILIIVVVVAVLLLADIVIGVKTQKLIQGLYGFMNSTRTI